EGPARIALAAALEQILGEGRAPDEGGSSKAQRTENSEGPASRYHGWFLMGARRPDTRHSRAKGGGDPQQPAGVVNRRGLQKAGAERAAALRKRAARVYRQGKWTGGGQMQAIERPGRDQAC